MRCRLALRGDPSPVLLAELRAPACAEVPAVGPDLNAYYYDPDLWTEIFERSVREVFGRRFQVVDALDIKPGIRIADVGAGTGLYMMLFSRAVGPAGRVYAVDISESFVEAIEARAKEYRVDNVVSVANHQQGTTIGRATRRVCCPALC